MDTIKINVDASEAVSALNELTAAIERARVALSWLTVSVAPIRQSPNDQSTARPGNVGYQSAIRDERQSTSNLDHESLSRPRG